MRKPCTTCPKTTCKLYKSDMCDQYQLWIMWLWKRLRKQAAAIRLAEMRERGEAK